jgi:RNA polymerase sigma factor (sigma-70 family)
MDAMVPRWPVHDRRREPAPAGEPDERQAGSRRGTQGASPLGPAGPADRSEEVVVGAWNRHHGELTAFLVRSSRDADAAEDLLQEAYLRLLGEVRAGREPTNVRAWLYRVAGNLAIDRGRRQASGRRGEARVRSLAPMRTVDEPAQALLEKECVREHLGALAGLSPRSRRVLALAAEGFSGEEIAGVIGCSSTAARTILHRARTQARRSLVA